MHEYLIVPWVVFFRRMLLPFSIIFLTSFFIMGEIATSHFVKDYYSKSTVIPQSQIKVEGRVPSVLQWKRTVDAWTHIPEICQSTLVVSEFHKKQCENYWTETYVGTAVSVFPFIAIIIFILFAVDFMSGFYKRVAKKIQLGKASCVGVVTEPSWLPNDFFSYFFCLVPICIQKQDGEQIKAYVSMRNKKPVPGDKLALFEAPKAFGGTRYLGVLYAPHIVVLVGG
ncbi:MAG: hypothetical protein HY843_02650 [Bdellovibrio sp.]|nr:hypothetical protein [Bdellovibrio sp.]